jgi:hypothetical protein
LKGAVMNAINLLKEDHRKVEELFARRRRIPR